VTCCAANVVVRVKAPPLDLDADLIERVLDRHWGIRSAEVRYLPVGFGDHHWHVNAARDNYFVTVRDLRLDGRADDRKQVLLLLEQTFKAVRQLRQLADLNFIVPAVPTTSGSLVVPLGDHFALSVYNWLDVQPAQDADGAIAAGLVARLHVASRERQRARICCACIACGTRWQRPRSTCCSSALATPLMTTWSNPGRTS
jgi:hypothetical protein